MSTTPHKTQGKLKRPLWKGFCRGQSAVLIALAAPVLIGSIGLGSDVAILYFNWSTLRTATDAAVLAGAAYLPSNVSLAQTTAGSYGQKNGLTSTDATSITIANNNTSITMNASRSVPYNFARVFGLTSSTVALKATAQIESPGSAVGLVPVGLDYHTSFTPYQQVTLIEGQSPGNWEPLAMGYSPSSDPGGSNYKNNIISGYSGTTNIGDWIYTETGQLNGPTRQGFNTRISSAQSVGAGTALNHVLNDLRVVEIPIVDFSKTNGKSQVPVKGFAVLWIVSVNSNGTITTDFIDQVMSRNTPSATAPQYGAFYPILVN
jgi:Flp pilus assembly protein TadG